jgi:hypothetical protein
MTSVGVGLGDFIALPTFALKVYQVCRDAPEDFWDLAAQVKSLSQLLQNVNSTLLLGNINETTKAQGLALLQESNAALKEVEKKLAKFRTQKPNHLTKRDFLRWVIDDLASDRTRIQGNTINLTAYLQNLTV